MRRLKIAVCITGALVIALAVVLFATTPKPAKPVGYTIYVNDDGSAQIEIDSINGVMQLHEDVEVAGTIFKAGTVVLPGDGNEVYYEYTRKDKVINNEQSDR